MGGAGARLRAFWATTQGKVAIIGSGAGIAGLLGLRARNKKTAGGGIAPAVATPPGGDTSYAGGQASGPLGPPGFGSNFFPTPSTVGTGTGIMGRGFLPVADWQGPNYRLTDPVGPMPAVDPAAVAAMQNLAPPAASAPVQPVAIINTPAPYTSRPAPVTGSPIGSITQRFTSPYEVATNQQVADYMARAAWVPPSAPAPVAPTPVQVTSPYQVATNAQVGAYLQRNAPAPAKTPAPVAARPGPGPPLKGPR